MSFAIAPPAEFVPFEIRLNTSFVVLYVSTLNPPLGGAARYVTGYDEALAPADRSTTQ